MPSQGQRMSEAGSVSMRPSSSSPTPNSSLGAQGMKRASSGARGVSAFKSQHMNMSQALSQEELEKEIEGGTKSRLQKIQSVMTKRAAQKGDKISIDEAIENLLANLRGRHYLRNFGGHVLFCLVFHFVLIYLLREPTDLVYQLRRGLFDLFVKEEFSLEDSHIYKSFYDIQTQGEVWQWLQGPVANGLAGATDLPNRQGYVMTSNRVVGSVRVRQLRVKPEPCELSSIKGGANQAVCYPWFSRSQESHDSFGQLNSFEWSKNSNGVGFRSYQTGVYYPSSGFNVDITVSRNASAIAGIFANLRSQQFIDKATRALFLNLNLFSENTDSWFSMQLLIEMLPTGGVQTGAISFKPLNLYCGPDTSSAANVFRTVLLPILLAMMVMIYVIDEWSEMNQYRKYRGSSKYYFMRFWNIVDIVNLSLFIILFLIWVAFLVNNTRSKVLSVSMSDQPWRAQYVELEYLVDLFGSLVQICAFNYLLTIVKLFKFLAVNRRLSFIWEVLDNASRNLVPFAFLVLVMVLGFGFMGFALYGAEVYEFRRLNVALSTTVRQMIGQIPYDDLDVVWPVSTPMYMMLFAVFIVFVMVNMFIGILNESWRTVSATLNEEESPLVQKIQKRIRKRLKAYKETWRWAILQARTCLGYMEANRLDDDDIDRMEELHTIANQESEREVARAAVAAAESPDPEADDAGSSQPAKAPRGSRWGAIRGLVALSSLARASESARSTEDGVGDGSDIEQGSRASRASIGGRSLSFRSRSRSAASKEDVSEIDVIEELIELSKSSQSKEVHVDDVAGILQKAQSKHTGESEADADDGPWGPNISIIEEEDDDSSDSDDNSTEGMSEADATSAARRRKGKRASVLLASLMERRPLNRPASNSSNVEADLRKLEETLSTLIPDVKKHD